MQQSRHVNRSLHATLRLVIFILKLQNQNLFDAIDVKLLFFSQKVYENAYKPKRRKNMRP